MLINLWSTPRTGSVWYSFKLLADLRQTNPKAYLLSEFFNRFHLNMYRKPSSSGLMNIHHYEAGAWYEGYQLELGKIVSTKIFAPRERDTGDEENYRLELLRGADTTAFPLVLHNHVLPLGQGVYELLKQQGTRNIYIGRRNFLEQMASYAVAYHTKIFAQFGKAGEIEAHDITIDENVLEYLLERILFWEQLDKDPAEVVYYEDIDFNLYPELRERFPIKQNKTPAMERLSDETRAKIFELKKKYETFHCSAREEIRP